MQLEGFLMTGKPTYEELEKRVGDLEQQVAVLPSFRRDYTQTAIPGMTEEKGLSKTYP